LTQDIDLDGHDWVPIGNKFDPDCIYSGTFDGRGFTISNMTAPQNIIQSDFVSLYGLFGVTDADIKNVKVSGLIELVSTQSQYFQFHCIGGIAGTSFGSIFNCVSDVDISTSEDLPIGTSYIGGIVGRNYNLISNCMNYGDLSIPRGNTASLGGIVGLNHGTIDHCSNHGDLSGATKYIGGISGESSAAREYSLFMIQFCYIHESIDYCSNNENLPGATNYIGVIFGESFAVRESSPSVIQFCYNHGSIEQTEGNSDEVFYGGIAGSLVHSSIKNCYNVGSITVLNEQDSFQGVAGGLTGLLYYSDADFSITHSYFTSDVGIPAVGHANDDSGIGGIRKAPDEMKTEDFVELLNNDVGKFIFNPGGYPLIEPIVLAFDNDDNDESKSGSGFGNAQVVESQPVIPIIDEKPEVSTSPSDSDDIGDNDNTDKKESESPLDSGKSQSDSSKSNNIGWILGALSIVTVFALGYYFYNKNKE
jgi:hypothetical protein